MRFYVDFVGYDVIEAESEEEVKDLFREKMEHGDIYFWEIEAIEDNEEE